MDNRSDAEVVVVDSDSDSVSSDIGCCICQEHCRGGDEGHLPNCSHSFCYTCILTWSKVENTCPVCKFRFSWIERRGLLVNCSRNKHSDSLSCEHGCCICLKHSRDGDVGVVPCCSHSFCYTCILTWSKVENTCPVCKLRFYWIEQIKY